MFVLAGATASGKSSLAVELALRVNGEIVNGDAFQLYAGVPITTAQPTGEVLKVVPHHLYGVLPVHEACDAAKYRDLAMRVVNEIRGRGRMPIVVGGSGLYLKALTHGLAPLPPVDAALRQKIAVLTPEERVRHLLELDPDAEVNVPLSNDRYVSRALEVCLLTGQAQSKLRRQWQDMPAQCAGAVLVRPREELWRRIEQRTDGMLASGLLDEVRALPADVANVAKAIGVRQALDFMAGKLTRSELREAIVIATRQYAKRQGTWFRREKELVELEAGEGETDAGLASKLLEVCPGLVK